MSDSDVQAREVVWYRQHGRYPERVKRDGHGREFVIGDYSWNKDHPDKPELFECRFQRDMNPDPAREREHLELAVVEAAMKRHHAQSDHGDAAYKGGGEVESGALHQADCDLRVATLALAEFESLQEGNGGMEGGQKR